MERRDFIRACAGAAVAAAAPGFGAEQAAPRLYERVLLVDAAGKPLKAAEIPVNRNLIFNYPYAGTPCFLLRLDAPVKTTATLATADAKTYQWAGGTGADRRVVAYSAICAHKLTYPTKEITFISFRDAKGPGDKFARVIHCCSEHSQYDPAAGARVVAGPAPQPLAAILLDYEPARDELHAVGTLGGEMFNDFFTKFEFRLALETGGVARNAVTGTAVVTELESYCRQQVKC